MSVIGGILAHKGFCICVAFGSSIGIASSISKSYSAETVASTYLFRVIPEPNKDEKNIDEIVDNIAYENLEKVPHSYLSLINGNTSYNNGNYVIYYGSEACIHCTGFIFGDQTVSDGSLSPVKNKMSDGTFMKAYASTRLDEDLKDKQIKFLMYEDIPEAKGDDYGTLPWAKGPKNEPDKGRSTNEYVRNDASARDFRKLFEVAQSKFGEKVSGTPTVIVYKAGKPVVFNQDTLPGLKAEKQDEAMSNDLQLKKFIKHYYTQVE